MILQRKFIIFSQRMADPVFGEKDTPQVGMAGEPDAAQVVDFALVPIGRPPDMRHGRHFGQFARLVILPARQDYFERKTVAISKALEVVYDFDMRLEAGLRHLL